MNRVAYKKAINNTINAGEQLIEKYKKLLKTGGQLFENEIADLKDIVSNELLPENIRIEAKSLLQRIPKK